MKKLYSALLFAVIASVTVLAQQITKPTLMPSDPTPEQKSLIREGIELHDAKMYPEAIAKYREVLEQNKDCVMAIYELALTYYVQKELDNALKVSLIGSRYKSSQLPLFYGMIGNIIDDQGNPEKAIKLYQEGINILKEDNGQKNHLSSLYYNMGVTYVRQQVYTEARQALKKAVEYNFSYASPNYLLAAVFYETKYKVPALLAAGRFISLENNTQRSKTAAQIFNDVLDGNVKKGDKPNTINIFVNPDLPKDEGDFGGIELFLGLSKAASDADENEKPKTEEEKFVGRIMTLTNLLLEINDKEMKNTFAGKNYLPYFAAMKSKGYIEAFAYLVMLENGNPQAAQWITANNTKFLEFLKWAKDY